MFLLLLTGCDYRRFPVVEKQWRAACKSENERNGGSVDSAALPYLPSDSELASSFAERKKRFVEMSLQ